VVFGTSGGGGVTRASGRPSGSGAVDNPRVGRLGKNSGRGGGGCWPAIRKGTNRGVKSLSENGVVPQLIKPRGGKRQDKGIANEIKGRENEEKRRCA